MIKRLIVWLVAALAALGIAGAIAQTPAPVPRTPILSMTKVANEAEVAPGALVAYTITVTNSGFGAAESIRVTDSLPRAIHWSVVADEQCDVDVALGNQILRCGFGLGPRHLDDSQTSFINPTFTVTAYGVAGGCGETYQNTALLVSGLTVLAAGPAVIKVRECPTPVPTATPPSTPTSAPTSTPTPQVIYVEVTPTPAPTVIRIAPLPPRTGNADSGVPVESNGLWLAVTILGLTGLAATVLIVRRNK